MDSFNTKDNKKHSLSRRSVIKAAFKGLAGIGVYSVLRPKTAAAQQEWPGTLEMRQQYHNKILTGIRILPGAWRPHCPYEQIAWVKPPWKTRDYIWMDFPEAIFTNQGLLFLSHINPRFPQLFPNESKVLWRAIKDGIAFERTLPNKITFGGSLVRANETTVALTLRIRNDSKQPLTNIILQTCAFLRLSKEFSEFTADNKFVHLPEHGWLPFPAAQKMKLENGKYHLGWRGGPKSADLPVMVTKSRPEQPDAPPNQRMAAFTWGKNTYSLISNPNHPCMHADPTFPDIASGQSAAIHGKLIFYEGSLEGFRKKFFAG